MMDSNVAHTEDDEIDLLDLLIVIADNLKLLILGPLLVGIVALGIAFVLPKTYESQSILNPSKPSLEVPGQLLASYIKSADVIESVAQALNYEPDMSAEQRYKKLERKIHVSVGKQDQLVTLRTEGHTPESARELNTTVWNLVLPLTKPRSTDRQRLQAQLKSEQERLASGEKMESATAKLIMESGGGAEGASRMYSDLLAANSMRLRSISNLESQLEGLSTENLAQLPTLPEASLKPKKGFIAVAATLAAGFLLLLFVFARHALQGASRNPEQADKVKHLRQALGMKP